MKQRLIKKIINYTDHIITLLLILIIGMLIFYTAYEVYKLFVATIGYQFTHLLHNTVYIIVLIKAYKILTHYLESHHVNVKYIIEVAIIAPAIEVIFASDMHELWLTSIFAVFSIINMYIYFRFHDRILQYAET